MQDRPRVLVIAEAANPEWVSVPLVGWSLARALREVADVHLVTQSRNRDAILRFGLEEGRDFTAIDSEAVARPLWALGEWLRMGQGRGWTMLQLINALSYPYFERLIWRRFRGELAAGRFDIVHRITPLSPTISSPLAPRLRRLGVPFVLGPLNGGLPWPPEFDAERRREREWLSYLRGAYRVLPGRGRTLKAASAIIVGSRHTKSEIPAAHRDRCIYLPENGIDPARFPRLGAGPPQAAAVMPCEPLRACFIGRMVPYKGPDILLEAAAPLLRDGRLQIDMIGDGPLLADLKAQAAALGVCDAVWFHGWLPHTQIAAVAGRCAVLAFPSIREFGGGVVLEAMAMGLVPVVVDYGGPGELVDAATGIKLPLGPRAALVEGFAQTLRSLAQDPSVLPAMAEAGRACVAAQYTWPRKAAQIAEIHDWVLGRRGTRPTPF